MERSEVPGCEECTAWEENPPEYVEEEVCPECCWSREVKEPAIFKLLDFLSLQDSGCPLGRHELTNFEWLALGALKAERAEITAEKAKKDRQDTPPSP